MLTDSNKYDIQNLYESGWNVEDIAEELGLSETEVLDYVDDLEQSV